MTTPALIGRRTVLALAATLAESGVARAAYPDRPIRLVIPYGGGGQTDIVSRLIGDGMAQRLGQTVLPDNRVGAAGDVAAELVSRALADGYTILSGSTGTLGGVNAALYRNPGYDWQRDLLPIGMFCTAQNVLLVHASLPVRSLSEFLDYVRMNPDKVPYASSGIGATTHLSMEMLLEQAGGLRMIHVPYRQSTQGMTDLLAGRVKARCLGLPEAEPVKADPNIRALAVTGSARNPQWSDIPTVAETLPGFEAVNAFALGLPGRTPPDIVAQLSKALNAALANDTVRAGFLRVGADPAEANTPEEAAAFLRRRGERWAALIRRLEIVVQ
ncbi:tripartite tricarboxylate transporter substrate binding protein [Roseomonas nepalensis]|uniref:Tripartite tricarboxylate transporter substrate binding protein n=1 Tax=Muricoccus nepalensis TaxID=1854500 RepID=A0A502G8M8_9PROT|nr:tripartite tricarboxylate transporter substrate binding protein [Roseomonas nepalensis]TPG57113.1 tripartite tricarboxylate transporter substrate binding protein [Roseomonas nepalensis]